MSLPTLSSGVTDIGLNEDIKETPFPAATKFAAGVVRGVETDVSSVYFVDKILITITQGGRLSQWIQVPLASASPAIFDTTLPAADGDMLPLSHLNPKTLLGAGGDQRETVGHLYASQISTAIANRNPEESRTVVVGLGFEKIDLEREAFFDILELVHKVI